MDANGDTIVTFNTRHFGLIVRFGVRAATPREFLTTLRSSTRANRAAYDEVLGRVAEAPPPPGDAWPPDPLGKG
ncbi:MAG: hypothetical protein WC326_12030 [Candidatus Delongbacteria bacterium]